MAREDAPGGLDTEAYSAVEAFFQQEALRYRRALVAIELATERDSAVRKIAREALDAGDEAAG